MKSPLFFFLLLSTVAFSQVDSNGVMHPRIDPVKGGFDSATTAWFNKNWQGPEKRDSIKNAELSRMIEKTEQENKNTLLPDKEGKGNYSFTVTVSSLELYIRNGITVKQLEQKLGGWSTNHYSNYVSLEWDDKTHEHDIPCYNVRYETDINGKSYMIEIKTNGAPKYKIKHIEVTSQLNGIQLASFKRVLWDKKYMVNKTLSRLFKKETWEQNIKKTLVFTIAEEDNGDTTIGVF